MQYEEVITADHRKQIVHVNAFVAGFSSVMELFCAALTDHKILFHSQSYVYLTQASNALTSLMFPLKYRYKHVLV